MASLWDMPIEELELQCARLEAKIKLAVARHNEMVRILQERRKPARGVYLGNDPEIEEWFYGKKKC